jgi:hypothetical protein
MKTKVLLRLLFSILLLSYPMVFVYLVSVQVYQPEFLSQGTHPVYFLLGSMMVSQILGVIILLPLCNSRSFS